MAQSRFLKDVQITGMSGQKLTIQDIKSTYLEVESDFRKVGNLWGAYVFRNIGFYPTWLCLRLGVSANQVTIVSWIFELTSFVFFAVGSYTSVIIGAVLINVWALLEHVDGNIARCTNSCSRYGAFLDFLSGSVIAPLLFISIGIGLFRHPDPVMNSLASNLSVLDINSIFLFLGTWTALACVLSQFIRDEFVRTLSINLRVLQAQRKTALYYLEIIAHNLFCLSGVLMPLVLLGAIFSFLSTVILAWALINTGYFVSLLILLLKKGAILGR